MHESIYTIPKHFNAVDCVIFGYEEGTLKILLFRRKIAPSEGEWSLIGGWVKENETVEDSASRVLKQVTGLQDIFMEQVHVFSRPERDPGGRVISLIFYAMICIDKQNKDRVNEHGARWFSFEDKPSLIFDHNKMLESAHEKLKQKANYFLIGKELLPSRFTILQLRTLYEAIFQRKFDPANFRKKVLSLKVLKKLNEKNRSESKKGAYYYCFKSHTGYVMNENIVKLRCNGVM